MRRHWKDTNEGEQKGREERREGSKSEKKRKRRQNHMTAEVFQKRNETAPETHFSSLVLLSYSFSYKRECRAVTQSARSCWQPARSCPCPDCRALRSAKETGGFRVHLAGPHSLNSTCARGDTTLQQTKPADRSAGWKARCNELRQVHLRACTYTCRV